MYAKLLRFDVGFGRPQLAEQIATESQSTMARHPGFERMELLADYLGGRYTLIAYWRTEDDYYNFSYAPDAVALEKTVDGWMSGVPFTGFYTVYDPKA
ncbi:MAG: hypothetical protein U0232_29980 [Thermomicrobiales bacterium]